ncbi:MAG: c-type cytochrome [Pseudobdellovibrio sp.]
MNKIIILAGLLLLSSCNYNQSKNKEVSGSEVPQKITSPNELTYKILNDAVIAPACLSCHSDSGGNKAGLNLETYAKVFAKKDLIKDLVAKKEMPPASREALSDQQIKMIIDWIDAGALENGKIADVEPVKPVEPPAQEPPVVVLPPEPPPVVVVPPPPVVPPVIEPEKIYFAKVYAQVIETNCLKCHSAAGGNSGDVNLETYANVFDKRHEIKFEVENGTMPTKRGTPLTPEQKKLIISWIEQGSPEKAL